MITLQELKTVEEKFNRRIEGILDTKEAFDNYDRYYKWLIDKYKDETTTDKEVIEELLVQQFKLIKRASVFIERFGLQAKEVAKHWNKGLIKRVFQLVEDQLKATEELNEYESTLTKSLTLESILNSNDLGTVCCSFSILEKVMPKLLTNCIRFLRGEEDAFPKKKENTVTVRKPKTDKNIKYWHPDAQEYMTYDECTERGLGHHLLCYPKGHDLQFTFVGFHEPDPSKCKYSKASYEENIAAVKKMMGEINIQTSETTYTE